MLKKIIALSLSIILIIFVFCSCAQEQTITIASKDFTENVILAEIMAQIIEKNSNINVIRKFNMGGTFVCFEAMKKGQVDIYPEYTGTGLTAQLKLPVENNSEKVYEIVSKEFEKQYNIKWLKPIGFNNTYTLAMPSELAEKYNIKTMSDLALYSNNFIFGAEHEFFNREDGYDGLVKIYGLTFKDIAKMNVSLKYQAIGQGKMQVTDAFTTDAQLKALDLKVLKDDKNFFPPYYAAPIIRNEILKAYPQIENLLNNLAGTIDDLKMQELNYKLDNEKQPVKKIAEDFLKENNIIK